MCGMGTKLAAAAAAEYEDMVGDMEEGEVPSEEESPFGLAPRFLILQAPGVAKLSENPGRNHAGLGRKEKS